MDKYILIELIIINFIFVGVLSVVGFFIYKELKLREKLLVDKLTLEYKLSKEDFDYLDYIIELALDDYSLLAIKANGIDYINEEIQRKMISEISTGILKGMSPSLLYRLSMIYDSKSIPSVVQKKVALHVLEYTIENNSEDISE